MIIFNELREFTKNIITPKRIIDGDKDLSVSEILSGKYFPCFKWSNNPSLVIDGLYVDNGIIGMKWQKIESVEIQSSEICIKPIGGSIELKAEAQYRLYCCELNGSAYVEDEYYKPINAVFHISDNSFCTLNKNILTIDKNDGEKERTINVSVSYRQGKIVKENTITITQLPNTISDWILTEILPIKLVLQSNIDTLPKDGGIVDLKVFKHSLKKYHKEDANGCILKDKYEETIVENVTSLCSFKIFNGDYVKLVGSHAIVSQQKEESNPRTFEIMANLAHLTASKTFSQEGGSVAHYDYELAYMCTNQDSYVLELPTSVICDGYQPIKFVKNKYLDGVLCGKIGMQAKDLKFQCVDENFNISYKDYYKTNWCKVSIEKHDFDNDEILQIYFEIFENALKDRPRIADDIIICGFDRKLHFTIIQPPLKVIKQEPMLEIQGETSYDDETISNAYIEFIPSVKTIYEDDSEETNIEIDDDCEIHYTFDNGENIIIKKFWKSDFNGKCSLIFDIKDKTINTSFNIQGNIFSQNNKFICSSNQLNITYNNSVKTNIEDEVIKEDSIIEEDIVVNVKVIVAKKEITEEIWSSESTLYINDDNGQTLYTLFLSPCWLYPNMSENEDVIYQGNVILKENKEYQFITTRFNLKKPISSIDYNINEKISFTKNENSMVIFIDL